MTDTSRPPLSLYIHVPWCVRKCPYCDFNSHALTGDLPEGAYRHALLEDLQEDLGGVDNRPIDTVFIGGGTPSLMSADFYHCLFDGLREHLTLAPDAEITLEANPGTLEQGRFRGFREAGINRLSIGVQSFQASHLEVLGRIHDADAARRAMDEARAAGFERFNVDLMHGLPDQTVNDAIADLHTAMAHEPPHISWYQLTLEPNTAFYSAPPRLPDEETLAAIADAGAETLSGSGYRPYEVSAWSRDGDIARHNLNYWQFGDYLALGAGAHGKITFPNGDIRRYWKTRQPEAYLNRLGSRTAGQSTIEPSERPLEFLMNALRLTDGVEEALFEARTGVPLSSIQDELTALRQEGLLTPDRLQTTPMGQRYLDSILQRFLGD
ncbi:anaerobic coproporphyrinogen III oxidase [Tamilnaduibacter salinus]|uniref:Heme chaperone HemW n=1 Tax=Tamilnaduibacter salinus TaxID=1484056 RepID=A0A2U1CXS8_9GAMM|nr:radical SAM family heme chaperone HemW [Tamilnaduibacter salinus]PVY76963.1 anaerobic coproporphyrinogen III oxidase [Tamilnaduibacter salinus]